MMLADQCTIFLYHRISLAEDIGENKFKIHLPSFCGTIVSRAEGRAFLSQIQYAESYANLICVRLRMFITCKEIPRRALSVFSQECQRVAFRPKSA